MTVSVLSGEARLENLQIQGDKERGCELYSKYVEHLSDESNAEGGGFNA